MVANYTRSGSGQGSVLHALLDEGRPATEKQLTWIRKMLAEKDLTGTAFGNWDKILPSLDIKEAGAALTMLFGLPRKPLVNIVAATQARAEGFKLNAQGVAYFRALADTERAEKVYKVVRSNTSGNLYAMVLDEFGQWNYDRDAYRVLVSEYQAGLASRLTRDQAAAYGKLTGRCIICGRELTNPVSIEEGIGPICGNRL